MIVPSIYTQGAIGGNNASGGTLPSGNVKLRFGEVKREILPTSQESYSKLYREYEVLVQHYEGGSATHRMYHHCTLLNDMCGSADYSSMSLRESDNKDFKLGNGSMVFILCVEGNDARAVIIGGPQQHKDISKGIHKELEFNGVNFQVGDDGSWVLTNKGKTDIKGNIDNEADKDGAGTQVKVEANGNFSVSTQNGKCSLSINHKDGTITINSSQKIEVKTSEAVIYANSTTIDSKSVSINSSNTGIGSNAAFHAVLGEPLAMVLAQALGTIGPTLPTPPQQALVAAAIAQLSTILSGSVRVAK